MQGFNMNMVKLSKYWRDIKFTDDSGDYEDIGEGSHYENQPHTIEEAIEELKGSEAGDNGDKPNHYYFDADHNLDGTITKVSISINATDEQLKLIKKGLNRYEQEKTNRRIERVTIIG